VFSYLMLVMRRTAEPVIKLKLPKSRTNF